MSRKTKTKQNKNFSSSRTPKHLLEGTRETKLLSMEITLDKSPDFVVKLYVDPTTINLVFKRMEINSRYTYIHVFIWGLIQR